MMQTTPPRRQPFFLLILILLSSLSASLSASSEDSSSDSSDAVVPLNSDNFHTATESKTVFIKCFAPWCSHCQELKPVWSELARDWTNHSQGLVAEVDCTRQKKLCEELRVTGLPTLLYGETSHEGAFLQVYNDDKSLDTLQTFANKTLAKPMCSPGNLEPCNADTKKQYEGYWKMSLQELNAAIDAKLKEIQLQEQDFGDQYKSMQKQYDELATNYEMKAANMKQKIKAMRAVLEQQE